MPAQSVDAVPQRPHVSIWQHAATGVLILGFVAAGWLRLNDCDLFNPDSPRYLIYAQSLADTGQYRAIDTPGAPLYTWRPPGLPMLLAPVLRFLPYDVVAAKCVVLLSAALLLVAVHALASSAQGGWSGPAMVIAVASSPIFLSLSTEVLSEVPYALGVLAVLYWIGRLESLQSHLPGDSSVASERKGSRRRACWAALSVLAFTPLIRTVGVVLGIAVGLWCLSARRRWRLLPGVALAAAPLGWLAWRSRLAPGNNYAGSLWQSFQEHGLAGVLADAWRNALYYGSAFPGVLLPGLTGEQPFYSPMVVGTVPLLSGFGVAAVAIAAAAVALGAAGMWRRRHGAGAVGLVYLLLYCACLSVWPWRHERFLWPLVPLIWVFVPAGLAALPGSLRRLGLPAAVAGLLALCGWQSLGSAALVETNQRFLSGRDAFYREQAPGFYFSDWRQAGRWIREHTPPQARLLTWQAAVGGTAHRFQRRVQFEAMTPEQVRRQIAAFPARYLVVTTAQFGLGFGWQQVFADPSYSLTVVYHDRDVAVLETGPNLSGAVSRSGYDEWIQAQRAGLESMLARSGDRTDLVARQANLLQAEGHADQAIALLEGLVRRGVVTVRVCSSLGWLYLAEGKYAAAARYLDLARGLPNAEPVAESLANGARRARERLRGQPGEQSIDDVLKKVQGLAANLNFLAAERELAAALPRDPEHAELNYWRGYLHHVFGERELAQASYLRAASAGSTNARGKLRLLQWERALAASSASVVDAGGTGEPVDPNAADSHVRLAQLHDEHGWSGRAVAVLEAARLRFGDRPEIVAPLAGLYLRFARPEAAVPLFESARQSWPHDKSVTDGLAAAKAALRVPRF